MMRRLIPIEEFIGNYSILLDIDEVEDWGRENRTLADDPIMD